MKNTKSKYVFMNKKQKKAVNEFIDAVRKEHLKSIKEINEIEDNESKSFKRWTLLLFLIWAFTSSTIIGYSLVQTKIDIFILASGFLAGVILTFIGLITFILIQGYKPWLKQNTT